MTKIIRVSGCHDCPHMAFAYNEHGDFDYEYCNKGRKVNDKSFRIDEYSDKKTLPDNCPLEDDKHRLERGRYMELIMAIETKVESESRQETALRYIKEMEYGHKAMMAPE